MRPAFVLFGPAHQMVLALAVAVPIFLALAARRQPRLDRPVRLMLALLLGGGWIAWYVLSAQRGWISLGTSLPLNLCDWAALALTVAWSGRASSPMSWVISGAWAAPFRA
jgi:uncharacterized membrane protein YwaF